LGFGEDFGPGATLLLLDGVPLSSLTNGAAVAGGLSQVHQTAYNQRHATGAWS